MRQALDGDLVFARDGTHIDLRGIIFEVLEPLARTAVLARCFEAATNIRKGLSKSPLLREAQTSDSAVSDKVPWAYVSHPFTG